MCFVMVSCNVLSFTEVSFQVFQKDNYRVIEVQVYLYLDYRYMHSRGFDHFHTNAKLTCLLDKKYYSKISLAHHNSSNVKLWREANWGLTNTILTTELGYPPKQLVLAINQMQSTCLYHV